MPFSLRTALGLPLTILFVVLTLGRPAVAQEVTLAMLSSPEAITAAPAPVEYRPSTCPKQRAIISGIVRMEFFSLLARLSAGPTFT